MVSLQLYSIVIVFTVWVYTLVSVAITPATAVRSLPKGAWAALVLLLPILGTVCWFILGRPTTDPDRSRRPAALDPIHHEEFLRRVRARAEEQRRRHEEARKLQAEE